MSPSATRKTALIVGASRGLGMALALEYVSRDWQVTATTRGSRTPLHEHPASADSQLRIEQVDINDPALVTALRERLSGTSFDLLFVNAAITNGDVPVTEVPTDTFTDVMITNALSPVRVVESFRDLVTPGGTIGVMSSRQGSIELNTTAGYEVYRASKSALNQLMRCHAVRHADDTRTLLLLNPGWVRTDLGGSAATLSIDESIPGLVDTVDAHAGDGGLQFLDYRGDTVPW